MKAVFQNELYLTRKSQAIWLGMMALLVGFCYFEFLSLKGSLGELAAMVDRFPKAMMIPFGVRASIDTALGWYSCLYFWTGLLAFAYAMALGIGCVGKELKTGTAAFLFTKPVARRQIVLGKAAASVTAFAIFSVCSGICNYLLLIRPMGGLAQKWAALTTTVGLFLTQLVLFCIGFLLAAIIKRPGQAVGLAICFMLGTYILLFAAQYTQWPVLPIFSVLCWFDVIDVIAHGLRVPYLALAGLSCACCLHAAQKCWQNREL